VRDIRRRTRRKFSPEEKIRIVLEGLRGEQSISDLCRREGIDYVFFSEHFDLVDQEVLDNRGTTDHRPVRSVLKLVR
jgi:endonuclease/exonuclease/phosphatase family metal-dependent hydrolase